jgi:hypothetical protein
LSYIDLRIYINKNDGFPKITGVHSSGRFDLTSEEVLTLQEYLAQSDWGQIEFPNGVNEALDGTAVNF